MLKIKIDGVESTTFILKLLGIDAFEDEGKIALGNPRGDEALVLEIDGEWATLDAMAAYTFPGQKTVRGTLYHNSKPLVVTGRAPSLCQGHMFEVTMEATAEAAVEAEPEHV